MPIERIVKHNRGPHEISLKLKALFILEKIDPIQ